MNLMTTTTQLSPATDATLSTIRRRAYDDEARRIASEGVYLSHDEADALSDEALDWLRSRLGLRIETDDRGVECRPAAAAT